MAIGVKVRFLARLRELAGTEVAELKTPAGSTVADLYDTFRAAHRTLPSREGVRGAINHEFVAWDAVVSEGDEVAFIPPVSGGF